MSRVALAGGFLVVAGLIALVIIGFHDALTPLVTIVALVVLIGGGNLLYGKNSHGAMAQARTRPPLIEAQAWSVQTSDPGASHYARGDRVFHQKFGYGRVRYVEGNKLTVEFDKAGEKKVIDQFVARA